MKSREEANRRPKRSDKGGDETNEGEAKELEAEWRQGARKIEVRGGGEQSG